jgi:hypothetical protein
MQTDSLAARGWIGNKDTSRGILVETANDAFTSVKFAVLASSDSTVDV